MRISVIATCLAALFTAPAAPAQQAPKASDGKPALEKLDKIGMEASSIRFKYTSSDFMGGKGSGSVVLAKGGKAIIEHSWKLKEKTYKSLLASDGARVVLVNDGALRVPMGTPKDFTVALWSVFIRGGVGRMFSDLFAPGGRLERPTRNEIYWASEPVLAFSAGGGRVSLTLDLKTGLPVKRYEGGHGAMDGVEESYTEFTLNAEATGPEFDLTKILDADQQVSMTRHCQDRVGGALGMYKREHGRLPETLAELAAKPANIEPADWLKKGYLRDQACLRDAWGRVMTYQVDERGGYKLISLGSDGAEGGDGAAADLILVR